MKLADIWECDSESICKVHFPLYRKFCAPGYSMYFLPRVLGTLLANYLQFTKTEVFINIYKAQDLKV